MSEGADGCHVENRVRVLAIIYASLREDDGDEVDARVAKQWNGGAVREQLYTPCQSMSLATERYILLTFTSTWLMLPTTFF